MSNTIMVVSIEVSVVKGLEMVIWIYPTTFLEHPHSIKAANFIYHYCVSEYVYTQMSNIGIPQVFM